MQLSFGPVDLNRTKKIFFFSFFFFHIPVDNYEFERNGLTLIRNNQNRASCRNTLNGFNKNIIINTVNANGLTYGGILRLLLNKKLNKLRVHITPNIADNSIRCCSDKWFRGSNSNINTWLTPDDRQPYTLMPIKNINSIISNGPRYRRNATFRLSAEISWKMAERKFKICSVLFAAMHIRIMVNSPAKTTAMNRTIKLPENSPT